MEPKFKSGEKVYLINESHVVEEATVVMTISGFVTVRFTEREWGERVRENRLYATLEEAEAAIKKLFLPCKSEFEEETECHSI